LSTPNHAYAKSAWIKVQLKSGAIDVHPGVIALDCEDDLVLHLSGSHVTYKMGVWDSWTWDATKHNEVNK
jgi:hypothetical protein